MRFSNFFGITVNVRAKAIKSMIKSETLTQGACAEFSFPFGSVTSANLLLFVSLRFPSPFAMLHGTAGSRSFRAFSESVALPDFAEYDNTYQ